MSATVNFKNELHKRASKIAIGVDGQGHMLNTTPEQLFHMIFSQSIGLLLFTASTALAHILRVTDLFNLPLHFQKQHNLQLLDTQTRDMCMPYWSMMVVDVSMKNAPGLRFGLANTFFMVAWTKAQLSIAAICYSTLFEIPNQNSVYPILFRYASHVPTRRDADSSWRKNVFLGHLVLLGLYDMRNESLRKTLLHKALHVPNVAKEILLIIGDTLDLNARVSLFQQYWKAVERQHVNTLFQNMLDKALTESRMDLVYLLVGLTPHFTFRFRLISALKHIIQHNLPHAASFLFEQPWLEEDIGKHDSSLKFEMLHCLMMMYKQPQFQQTIQQIVQSHANSLPLRERTSLMANVIEEGQSLFALLLIRIWDPLAEGEPHFSLSELFLQLNNKSMYNQETLDALSMYYGLTPVPTLLSPAQLASAGYVVTFKDAKGRLDAALVFKVLAELQVKLIQQRILTGDASAGLQALDAAYLTYLTSYLHKHTKNPDILSCLHRLKASQ